MIKDYQSLLPSYLNGPNIRKHAEIISQQDKILDNKIHLLSLWNIVTRPVMFEYDEDLGTINVHVDSHLEIIKNITITVSSTQDEDDIEEYNFNEDDCRTTWTEEYELVSSQKMEVVVETYNCYEYNGIWVGSDYSLETGVIQSYDEFLDKLGVLFRIPRKEEELDYNYSQRLQFFIEHYGTMELNLLMLYVIYGVTAENIVSLTDRTSSIPEYMKAYAGSPIAKMITDAPSELAQEIQTFTDQFCSITRPYLIQQALNLQVGLVNPMDFEEDIVEATGYQEPYFPNCNDLYAYFTPSMYNTPIRVIIDNTYIETVYTSMSDGKVHIRPYGLPRGTHEITLEYLGEHEIQGTSLQGRITTHNEIIRNNPAWQQGIHKEYTGTPAEPEFVTEPVYLYNGTYLYCGKGYLLYTPILDYKYIDKSSFSVYGTIISGITGQKIGIIKVSEDETGIQEEQGIFIDLLECNSDVIDLGEHEFTFDFKNNEIYVWIDGEPVGIRSNIIRDEGVWYLGAYDSNSNDSTPLLLGEMYVDGSVNYGDYPIIGIDKSSNWHVIEGTNTNRRQPSFNNGYDIGRYDISVLSGYNILKETTNTTIEISFNTRPTTGFRIGIIQDKTNTVTWSNTFYNATDDNSNVGNNVLKFISDEEGVWKTYLNNTRTSTQEFTLNNDRNIGFINYQSQTVKINEIKIYENE